MADPPGPESKPLRENCSADLVGGRSCLWDRPWHSPRRGCDRRTRSRCGADSGRLGARGIGDERRARGAGRPRRRAQSEHGEVHCADYDGDVCSDLRRGAGSFSIGDYKRRSDDHAHDSARNESADDATDIDDRSTCGDHGATRIDYTAAGRDDGATCSDHATAGSDHATAGSDHATPACDDSAAHANSVRTTP